MSRRTQRVASVIRDVVAEAIPRMNDPRLEPLTSITRVEVSPDLSIARVNVSVLADAPARRQLSVDALRAAAGRMRAVVGEHLSTRQIPRLEFHLDESLRRSFETVQVIDHVMENARSSGDTHAVDGHADDAPADLSPDPEPESNIDTQPPSRAALEDR